MPAADHYHNTVVRALVRDGWTITKEQARVRADFRQVFVDIEAAREAESLLILVEVKGFEAMPSLMAYLADTIGQYVLYRAAIEYSETNVPLYLAVPLAAHTSVLSGPFVQYLFERERVSLMVFDAQTEEIVQWIRR